MLCSPRKTVRAFLAQTWLSAVEMGAGSGHAGMASIPACPVPGAAAMADLSRAAAVRAVLPLSGKRLAAGGSHLNCAFGAEAEPRRIPPVSGRGRREFSLSPAERISSRWWRQGLTPMPPPRHSLPLLVGQRLR